MEIRVRFSEQALVKKITDIEKQVNFATAKALTDTAKQGQLEVIDKLPSKFTIRTQWVKRGIRIRAANKSNLTSKIVVFNEFMELQERGGNKRPIRAKTVSVPVGARPTKKSVTRPSKFPSRMLAKRGYYMAPVVGRSKIQGVWYKRGKRSRPKLMYTFRKSVTIKPRFDFFKTVKPLSIKVFPNNFKRAFRRAIATAR